MTGVTLPSTPPAAQKFVVTSLVVTGGLAVVNSIAGGHVPPVRIGVGLTVAGVMLAVGAEVAPELAAGMALLMAASAVFVYGAPAWSLLSGATKPGGAPAPKTQAAQPLTPLTP